VPFLIDLLRLPADLFALFVAVDVFTGRFSVMLAAMFLVVMSLLGTFMRANLRASVVPLLRFTVITLVLVGLSVAGLRLLFAYVVSIDYQGYKQFIALDLIESPQRHRVLTNPQELAGAPGPVGSRLGTISERGTLRVCFLRDSLPFVFYNEPGRLVGFDIEMAHSLARQLDTSVDFVQIERSQEVASLDAGVCDILMSGYAITASRAREVLFPDAHMEVSLAFVVLDHRRLEFTSWQAVQGRRGLRIGVPSLPYYQRLVRKRLPDAELVPIDSIRSFFTGAVEVDALVYAAEPAAAWTLVYPLHSVVVPRGGAVKVPLAYPLPRGETEFARFVNVWLDLKRADGTDQRVFEHWILGEGARPSEPRWSVIRDVLHWVD
jgi:ABC-type amino acid transport substrate-binding protein